ncbi:MAG: mannonate dehydratase [Chthonomonadaceae bacterium]|nr:mannonate dehydratase [Chthonomonadaceae bacterium]
MRWYGPGDSVSLRDIRQAGCQGVVTALHQVPVGEVWSVDAILERRALIEAAGLEWRVVESLPVHDAIKRRDGERPRYIDRYRTSLENLAKCGVSVVTYNFMPVFDWLRTDVESPLADGSNTLRFDRSHLAAFDLYVFGRPGAEGDYSPEEVEKANRLSQLQRDRLTATVLMGLPGSDEPFTLDGVRQAMASYADIDAAALRENLGLFLRDVVPTAEENGVRLAIHPDDPPFPVFGLPRVVSTEADLAWILDAAPSPSNGLCFCTGSLGVRPDNDVPAMLGRLGSHVHFLHLRNTRRDGEGGFCESGHLEGDTDMAAVMRAVLEIMRRRGEPLPMRPDHGLQMLDDLHKRATPGYSAIGRLKGLAELRGLEMGLASR